MAVARRRLDNGYDTEEGYDPLQGYAMPATPWSGVTSLGRTAPTGATRVGQAQRIDDGGDQDGGTTGGGTTPNPGGGGTGGGGPDDDPNSDYSHPAGPVGTYMPGGVDINKWNDPKHATPKYLVLRLLSMFPPTPAGLKDAMSMLRELDPDARLIGLDTIDLPNLLKNYGGGTVDVITSAHSGGTGWQWGWNDPNAGAEGGGGTGGTGGTGGGGGFTLPNLGGGGGGGGIPGFGGGGEINVEEAIRKILASGGVSTDPLTVKAKTALQTIIEGMGALEPGNVNRRIESARETLEGGRRAMLEQTRANLADRGLISLHGSPQGSEADSIARISDRLGQEFAGAQRDIITEESHNADQRLQSALATAANISQGEAQTMLGALGAGNQRNATLAQIAIETLKNNTQWNEFLAQYGLDRDRLLLEAQQGNMSAIMPILQMFLQIINSSRTGHA